VSRTRLLLLIGLTATAAGIIWLNRRGQPEKPGKEREGERRLRNARAACDASIRERFRQAGLAYPPAEIFLRAFKNEAQLELWARESEDEFRLVATWPILASSGKPGPKRREGDRQVPEGFYMIDHFNPESSYHLSLGLDYPNASDRLRSDREHPGSDIYIHGSDQTIGCLPLGDRAIEELYLIALDTDRRSRRKIPVHIFPARMSTPSWDDFARGHAADPDLLRFWDELRPGYQAFESGHQLPRISVEANGAYRIESD